MSGEEPLAHNAGFSAGSPGAHQTIWLCQIRVEIDGTSRDGVPSESERIHGRSYTQQTQRQQSSRKGGSYVLLALSPRRRSDSRRRRRSPLHVAEYAGRRGKFASHYKPWPRFNSEPWSRVTVGETFAIRWLFRTQALSALVRLTYRFCHFQVEDWEIQRAQRIKVGARSELSGRDVRGGGGSSVRPDTSRGKVRPETASCCARCREQPSAQAAGGKRAD